MSADRTDQPTRDTDPMQGQCLLLAERRFVEWLYRPVDVCKQPGVNRACDTWFEVKSVGIPTINTVYILY